MLAKISEGLSFGEALLNSIYDELLLTLDGAFIGFKVGGASGAFIVLTIGLSLSFIIGKVS